jgi:AcrR family transcriptional regulator
MPTGSSLGVRRDRRRERHDATRREILDAARAMMREEGLAALSLRGLAREVGMEPQSLYTYFSSKHAIYDALFARGNTELLARCDAAGELDDPIEAFEQGARIYIEFCVEDLIRYQLLFQRTIPGFEPSAESYKLAKQNLDWGRRRLADIGVTDPRDLDLWTAMLAGLLSQQFANDPGGNRWTAQLDRVIDMYLKEVGVARRRRSTKRKD